MIPLSLLRTHRPFLCWRLPKGNPGVTTAAAMMERRMEDGGAMSTERINHRSRRSRDDDERTWTSTDVRKGVAKPWMVVFVRW